MDLRPRHGLSLCAGYGGLDMGLQLAEPRFETRVFVEWDKHAQAGIIAAQRAGYFAPAPIWDDLRTFDGRSWRGRIDTILAGYPCQPFSTAGQRKGESDPRHLWPEVARVIGEVCPEWVFLENVAGHVTLGLETVLRELWAMGYTPAAGLFSAAETGASHQRQRVFIVAHCTSKRAGEPHNTVGAEPWQQSRPCACRCGGRCDGALAHGNNNGFERGTQLCAGRNPDQGECRADAERSGGAMDHAAGTRCQPSRSGADIDPESGQSLPCAGCDDLADTGQPGPQGRKQPGSPEERHGQAAYGSASECGRPWLYPPGPGHREAWAGIIRDHPYLAPASDLSDCLAWAGYVAALEEGPEQAAAQSALCRMVDGLAARSRALRGLGNGVVPLAAGYAWRTLAAAHGLRPVDLETIR